jgi:hypothetical protein
MTARKLKISLTISVDVLESVDHDARRSNETRSAVVDRWLRRAAQIAAQREIDEATAAYYLSLRGDEAAENDTLARALSAAARRVSYDDATTPRGRRGTR